MRVINNLSEIQKVSLNLLESFDEFCKKNNLRYFLAWGTLLGSVRHKGFIPWDDDIDLMMLREDYDKLIAMNIEKISDNIRFYHSRQNNKYVNANCRIADEGTIVDLTAIKNPVKQGIWLTIFPLDNMPEKENEKKIYLNKINLVYKLLLISTLKNEVIPCKSFKGVLIKCFNMISTIGVSKFLYNFLDGLLKKYSHTKTKEIGLLSIGTGAKTCFTRASIEKVEMCCFEGKKYPIPKGYDEILTNTYGDYMKLPPIEQRIPKHDYIAYYKY